MSSSMYLYTHGELLGPAVAHRALILPPHLHHGSNPGNHSFQFTLPEVGTLQLYVYYYWLFQRRQPNLKFLFFHCPHCLKYLAIHDTTNQMQFRQHMHSGMFGFQEHANSF